MLRIGDLDLELFAGGLVLRDVTLAPVDTTAARAAAAALTGGLVLEAAAERLDLSGLSYWALATGGRVAADSLTATAPRVLAKAYGGEPDPRAGGPAGGMPAGGGAEERDDGEPAVAIGGVRVSGAHLDWSYVLDTAAATLEVEELDLVVAGIALDSFAVGARALVEGCASFRVRVGGYRHELPDSLHVVTLDAAAFDSRGGRLTLEGMAVRPRVRGFGFRQTHPRARLALDVAADSVALEGFALGRFLRTGDYRAARLRVGDAEATAWVDGAAGGGGGAEGAGIGLDLAVDTVDLAGVRLRYRARAPELALDLSDADVLLTGVRTPPPRPPTADAARADSAATRAPFDIDEAELRFRDFAHVPADGEREVSVTGGRLDYRAGSLVLDGLRYGPPDEAVAVRGQRSTLTVEAGRLALEGLDLDGLFWRRTLTARAAEVAELDVRATTNLDAPAAADSAAARPLLLARLRELTPPLAVDEVAVSGARVAYRRLRGPTDVTLDFADTYATFYHLGTTEAYASAHPRCEVDIRTRFAGVLPVGVSVDWPNAAGVPYRLSARADSLSDLTLLNRLLVPLADLRVDGGALDSLAFAWTADGRAGEGRLTAAYRGFEVSLLGDGPGVDERDVASWIANAAAIRGDAAGRSGPIAAEREAAQGMFGHWWALLRSGLDEVVLTGVGRAATGR